MFLFNSSSLLLSWQLQSYWFIHLVWVIWITIRSWCWSHWQCKYLIFCITTACFDIPAILRQWFSNYVSPLVKQSLQVIQSWYVMGRLGAFNSSNLQVLLCFIYFGILLPSLFLLASLHWISKLFTWQIANSSLDCDPLYDVDQGSSVMHSSFHDISDVEFQDNCGRIWYTYLKV